MLDSGHRPSIAVVGAGPAGLMAAETAAQGGAAVTVYDRMPSPGRKFLLAGRGGLNLTHSEDIEAFRSRYGAAEPHLRAALDRFSPMDLRSWSADLGQPTFVGSSGRVFPASFKTSPLLRAWLRRLDRSGVVFRLRHRWTGWSPDGSLGFATPDGPVDVPCDAAVLALGGATWPGLGSDGAWVPTLADAGMPVAPLRPSNCGFTVDWSSVFRDRFEGQPLKGITLAFGDRSVRGEAVVTRTGVEGGAVYALSAPLREAIDRAGDAVVRIALRPDLAPDELERRLGGRASKLSVSSLLRKALKLSPVAIGLVHEARLTSSAPLAQLINAVPVRLTGTAPIARAISTAGGVAFSGVDEWSMLRARPGTFVAGEMLDWEAPTGGYLLQAAFATGAAAGRGALHWVGSRPLRAAAP